MVDKNVKEVDKMIFVVIFPRFSWFFTQNHPPFSLFNCFFDSKLTLSSSPVCLFIFYAIVFVLVLF